MSLGEHLEELRGCVVRSLIALVLACLLCIWPSKYLLGLIARPMVLALRRHDQPTNFLATGPAESLLVYVKVVVISGLVLAAPYIIQQLWSFVAAGLYRHEKAWVGRIVPLSVGLFAAGVVFMYIFALPVSLNFLIGFSSWLPLPEATPTALERLMLQESRLVAPQSQPATTTGATIPLVAADPCTPPVGSMWVNLNERRLKVRWPDATYSFQLQRDDQRPLVTNHLRIGSYLTFVLVMTLAFGAAFQTPLVVVFLARSGIVPEESMRKYRKVVILIIVIVAGILAPPDLLSHLMLSVPMVLLFELGLWLARRQARRAAAEGVGSSE